MRLLNFFLLFVLAVSMGTACSDEGAPGGKKTDNSHELDSLKSLLLGEWLDVSPDGDRNVYVFLSDTIYRKNVCSELTDTLLYQAAAKDTVRIAALGAIAHYSKIIVHNNDSITIADITLRRLQEGEEVECDNYDIERLVNIKWKLTSFVTNGLAKAPEPDSNNCYWLIFKDNSTFIGQSSTNEIAGNYEIDFQASTIRITKLGGTKINELFDGKFYMECLKGVCSFSFHGNILKLYYNETNYLQFNLPV